MSKDDSTPPVACTLTGEQAGERSDRALSVLSERYTGTEECPTGFTFVFDGTDKSLEAVATFVSNELQCCSFAQYTINVSPPFTETRLVVTGPEGTKSVFQDLIDQLELPPD